MKILVAAVPLLIFTSVHAAPPKPLLWKVSDADNSIYLLGSMHKLKADDYPLDPSVDLAFADAETIYFEVSPDEMNDPAMPRKLMSQGVLRGDETLKRRLAPEIWSLLADYCAANQIPVENFLHYKPWLASLLIASVEAQRAGLVGELGLDRYFMDLAIKQHKRTGSFETAAEQIAFFDLLSIETQEQFLYETLKEAGQPAIFERMHRLWRNGNAEGILQLLDEERKLSPQFFREFIDQRNHAWLPEISRYLERNTRENAMVVVGSAHLLGREGLIQLLKKKGYRAERLP